MVIIYWSESISQGVLQKDLELGQFSLWRYRTTHYKNLANVGWGHIKQVRLLQGSLVWYFQKEHLTTTVVTRTRRANAVLLLLILYTGFQLGLEYI